MIRNILNKNKKSKISARAIALMALFLMPGLFLPSIAGASLQDQLNNVGNQLQETNKQLEQNKAEQRSLNSQIAVFDSQIGSVQGEINNTSAEISRLNKNITDTKTKIKSAEADLKQNQDFLSEYLRISYEEGEVTSLEIIARSNSFSEFVNRSEYLETMQLKIKDAADKVVTVMKDLDLKKKQLEENKKKTEELQTQQLAQRQQLSAQKATKDHLLEITQGNEAEFQALKKKLQSQYNSIQAEIRRSAGGSGNYVSLGSVKAGDTIDYIGNSGFSSGPHLHFEIWNSGKNDVNPANYIGNGYFIHPVPGVYVSQGYGPTDWWAYSFHTGIDYADGGRGTPVRATADGDIIFRRTGVGNTYPYGPLSYGNYVIIRHTNGMYSLYGHLR